MNLKQLQAQFSESLFYLHDQITEQVKETDSLSPLQRLQVYRNSFIMGVSEALAITYQHTLALVGDDFFNAVGREFILTNPPHENNIVTYGEGFNEYLHSLAQLNEMPYIAEMARFEWLLEQTTNTKIDTNRLNLTELETVPEDKLSSIRFTIASHINLFQSEQNINCLYQMIIENNIKETDLNSACYLALKKHHDFRIEFIALSSEEFLLIKQLKEEKSLDEIMPKTLCEQLPKLLEKKLLNGFNIK